MKTAKVTEYKAPIRGIAKIILSLLTRLTGLFLNKIKDVEIRMMASGLLQSASDTVDALSDSDPNDKEQIRGVFNKLLSSGDFKKGAQLELLENIQKLTDEDARTALTIINDKAFPLAAFLTDEDPENSTQVKAFLVSFLRSEEGMTFFNSLFRLVLPPAIADMLVLVIIEALINFLDNEEQSASITDKDVILVNLHELKERYEARIAA